MCYLNLSLITDYDVGLKGRTDIEPVTMEEALRVFAQNIPRLREALVNLIDRVPETRRCTCSAALAGTPARQ
jgi:5'-methylthioadenosine phosphorylase